MRDFIGMESMFDEAVCKRTDHRFHAQGTLLSEELIDFSSRLPEEMKKVESRQPWWTLTDQAWVICLLRANIIDNPTAKKLLEGLDKTMAVDAGASGEERLAPELGDDMDTASIINYGRTLQEPMLRLKLRDKMLCVFDDILDLMQLVHRKALEHVDTLMPGYTHLNQGQPITFGHWLLSVFDSLHRGLEQFELAYRHTNANTGGCGSCSGITWKVDRELLSKLLGLDRTVESTYECEAAQDHSLSALFALSNIVVLLSQCAMNMNIWSMDEIDMLRTPLDWCGCSSYMPQKCDSGSNYERTRVKACDALGEMFNCVLQLKGEPHADMQAMFQLPDRATRGMIHARECITFFRHMLNQAIPQKERMKKTVRAGYSCATELATELIQKHGYGGRGAHSVVATLVRNARCKGLKSYECTGNMLDEAAHYLGMKEPHLSDEEVRKQFDPEEFLKTHTNLGGASPDESRRLLNKRSRILSAALERHQERLQRIEDAKKFFESEKEAICK